MGNDHAEQLSFCVFRTSVANLRSSQSAHPVSRDHLSSPEMTESTSICLDQSCFTMSTASLPNSTMCELSSFRVRAKTGCPFLFPF